jgi:hypothetical protein
MSSCQSCLSKSSGNITRPDITWKTDYINFFAVQMVSAFIIQRLLIIDRTVRDFPEGKRNSARLPMWPRTWRIGEDSGFEVRSWGIGGSEKRQNVAGEGFLGSLWNEKMILRGDWKWIVSINKRLYPSFDSFKSLNWQTCQSSDRSVNTFEKIHCETQQVDGMLREAGR